MRTPRFGLLGLDEPTRPDPAQHTGVGQWIACPEPDCDATAEIVDRYLLGSTCGPVPMLRARCLGEHIRDRIDDQSGRD